MEEIKGWEQHERRLLTSGQAEDAKASGELGQRAQVLKDLAMALLNEVQTLSDVQVEDSEGRVDFYDEVRRFEIELIRRALNKTGGHQVRAARLLNVKVTTLNSKIKRYHIYPEAQIFNYPSTGKITEEMRRRA